MAALLPLLVLGGWQAKLAFDDSLALVANRLRANAWAIAESERDPFILGRHTLIAVSRSRDVRLMTNGCDDALIFARQGATGIANIIRTDAMGKIVCSAQPASPGISVDRQSWWMMTRGARSVMLEKADLNMPGIGPSLVMSAPLFTRDASFAGVVAAIVPLDALKSAVERKDRRLRGEVLLVDAYGRAILPLKEGPLTDIGDPQLALSHPRIVPARDGASWLQVSAPLFGQKLYIAYAEPWKVVTATALSRMWLILTLPVLAMVLSLAAIWFGTQWLILRWLPRLRRLTKRFSHGDFAIEETAYGNAPLEIAELGAELHDMGRALELHERDLREALAAKTALTREVNHRVKNNLQIVDSLLSLQAERATDPWTREMLGQTRSRMAALGLIHRLLYENEGLGEQGRINFRHLILELCRQLRSANRHRELISLDCDSEDIEISVEQAVPAMLFTVETVSNAFRHAFAKEDAGQITVRFTVSDGVGTILIADNGHGFLDSAIQGQMGMDLIHAFAVQLDGKVSIDSGSAGAALTLTFPLRPLDP